MKRRIMSSISPVVTPGTMCGVIMSSVSAASRPALCMPSNASRPWSLIAPVRPNGASAVTVTYSVMAMHIAAVGGFRYGGAHE